MLLLSPVRFKFHYPARGRKRVFIEDILGILSVVQIPLPRKGTETGGAVNQFPLIEQVQIPLPRKGTETEQRVS